MLAVGVSRAQAAEDTEPPVLESLSISPATVNTTSSAQTVTATAHITDNLSGAQFATIGIFSPGHHQIEPGFHLISNTDTDATKLDSEELEAAGFPNTVEVEDSAGDSDPLARPAVAQERPAAAQEPQIVAQGQNAAPFAGAAIANSTLLVSPSGTVSIDVSAPAGEECTGTVTLRTLTATTANTTHSIPRKHKSASVILAVGSFTVHDGSLTTVKLHLSAKGRALLARRRVLPVQATIVATDSIGATRTTRATVTLRMPKQPQR